MSASSRPQLGVLRCSTSGMQAPENVMRRSGMQQTPTSLSLPSLFRATGSSILNGNGNAGMEEDYFRSQMQVSTPLSPKSQTLAVRRLVPTGAPPGARMHSMGTTQNKEFIAGLQSTGSRSFVERPLAMSDSLVWRGLRGPFIESPSSSSPQRGKTPRFFVERGIHFDSPVHEQVPHNWKALAKESVEWLDGMPKESKGAAIAEIRQWVHSIGLHWDVWILYCNSIRPNAMDGSPKQMSAKAIITMSGPSFLGRLAASPHLNSVSEPASPYSAQMRPRIAQAQVQAMNEYPDIRPSIEWVGTNDPYTKPAQSMRSQASTPATSQVTGSSTVPAAVPHQSNDKWLPMVNDALRWLQQKTSEEQPAALLQMREWVQHTGMHWDSWWQYCQSVQKSNNRAALRPRGGSDEKPTSPGLERRAALSVDPDILEEVKDGQELETFFEKDEFKEQRAKKLASKKRAGWQVIEEEKRQLEHHEHEQWKQGVKSYGVVSGAHADLARRPSVSSGLGRRPSLSSGAQLPVQARPGSSASTTTAPTAQQSN